VRAHKGTSKLGPVEAARPRQRDVDLLGDEVAEQRPAPSLLALAASSAKIGDRYAYRSLSFRHLRSDATVKTRGFSIPPPRNSRFLTATSPGPTGADRSASLRSSQSDPGCSSTPSSRTALFVRISVTVTPSSASSRRPSEPSEPPWVSPQGQNSACFEDVVERGLGRHSHLREAGLEQDPV
jgi:hypothetical protein